MLPHQLSKFLSPAVQYFPAPPPVHTLADDLTRKQIFVGTCMEWHMDVSENSGTPKSSILMGFSTINHPFWGTPIFWKHPYVDIQPIFDLQKLLISCLSKKQVGGSVSADVNGVWSNCLVEVQAIHVDKVLNASG